MAGCVAFTDSTGLPEAASYFDAFRQEPIRSGGDITVAKVVPVPSMTLISLLTAIKQESGLKTLVLACHGSTQGLLIGLKIYASSNTFDTNAIDMLGSKRGDTAAEAKKADGLNLSAKDFTTLRDLSDAVRGIGISRVVIRGCKIGENVAVLAKLKTFFGCVAICAPTVKAYFGKLAVQVSSKKDWEHWNEQHPIATENDGFNYVITRLTDVEIALDTRARSREALTKWVEDHLGTFSGSTFPYELLRTEKDQLVFPREKSFRSYLASVPH
jgi:hypothetical protein